VSGYGINPATGRCRQCGKLQTRPDTNGMGRLVEVTDPCPCPKVRPKRTPAWRKDVDDARRLALVCQRCDEPVVGKPQVALYCQAHRQERRKRVVQTWLAKQDVQPWQRYAERNRETLRAKARATYQDDPAERERRNEYKRQWRKLNRDKVQAQKERSALRNFRDPAPTVRRWRAKVEAGEHKPKRARRNQHGERLCVTPYCRSVLSGRAKKCERCKAKEAAAARQALPSILKGAA
jgi:hypothetical protein